MSLKSSLIALARNGGGGCKTRSDRKNIVARISDHLKNDLNIQVRSISQIKTRHIEIYVQHRLYEGISKRSIQNEMAALRNVLAGAGRSEFANSDRLTNKSLGVSGASRAGTKIAVPFDKYQEILEKAIQRDSGVAACIRLAHDLGLRAEEAVQSAKSLSTWAKNLNENKDRFRVIFGTKGGRPRDVTIHPENRQAISDTIQYALEVARQQDGWLINTGDLKSAMVKFNNEARAIGLKGIHAPHALRYAFACTQLGHYEANGYSRKEALALVSCDLGHGDGRGWYIEHVYTKS